MDLIIKCCNQIICTEAEYANTFFKRFKGLMGRKSLAEGAGLLIEP